MAPSARALALKGLFSEPYDRFRLPAAVVTALVDFFDGRGESVADLSLSCAASDLERFEAEWHGYAADAGITSVGDQRKLTGWLSARMQSAAGAVTEKASGTAGVVINALEEIGRPLDGTEAASIRAKLAAKEKGEEADQCVGALCVAILYLGRAFKESEQKEYSAQFLYMGGVEGIVDVTRMESYIEFHNSTKDRDVLSLERAVRGASASLDKLERWLVRTMELLTRSGLPLASLRLMQLDQRIKRDCGASWAARRAYYETYFFESRLGIGLPVASDSAAFAAATGARTELMPPSGSVGSVRSVVPLSSVSVGDSVSQSGGSSVASSAETELASLRSHMAKLEAKLDAPPPGETPKVGITGVTGRSQCDFCRRSTCPLVLGLGRPCRQYNKAVELWRKDQKAQDDADKADTLTTVRE